MKIYGIMAADENWGIGYKGGLPWERVKEDMDFFRRKTIGHPVIMGRKTMESIGDKFPLEGRVNIVLSKTLEDPGDGSYFVEKSVIDAVSTAGNRSRVGFDNTEAYVIGGSEIFKEFVPMMSGMFVTIVKGNFKPDTFFNPFSNARLIEEVSSKTLRENDKFEIIYLDFRCDELTRIYYFDRSNFIALQDKDGLVKTIKYDEEIVNKTPKDHDKVALRGIKGMTAPDILSERRLKYNKQKPKDHTYVDGRVSVRELKKYFGVDSVSYGICGTPLKSTEVIDLRSDIHFYLFGSSLILSSNKIPDIEEISRDEVSKSIVKNIHRSTYLAEEIMDAYGLEKLLDSDGSFISRCDIIDLSENILIQGYYDRIICRVVKKNSPIPKEYLIVDNTNEFMEKSLIEKWDGYSGQNVRTVPEESKEEEAVKGDNPISPSYYESDKIKLRDVLDQNLSRVKDGALAFYLGNTWKYLWRWDRKENPIQDLNKAKKYIEFAVDRLKEINSEGKSTDNETPDRVSPVDTKDLWKMK